MPYSPEKFDSRKNLREDLDLQHRTAFEFFSYAGLFKTKLEYYDLENPSQSQEMPVTEEEAQKVNNYLLLLVETRNRIIQKYQDFEKDVKDEECSLVVLELAHQNFQKEAIDLMDRVIEETTFVALPAALPDEVRKDINSLRTKTIQALNNVRDRFYDNDLGKGGLEVLV